MKTMITVERMIQHLKHYQSRIGPKHPYPILSLHHPPHHPLQPSFPPMRQSSCCRHWKQRCCGWKNSRRWTEPNGKEKKKSCWRTGRRWWKDWERPRASWRRRWKEDNRLSFNAPDQKNSSVVGVDTALARVTVRHRRWWQARRFINRERNPLIQGGRQGIPIWSPGRVIEHPIIMMMIKRMTIIIRIESNPTCIPWSTLPQDTTQHMVTPFMVIHSDHKPRFYLKKIFLKYINSQHIPTKES